jgi:hypothetical protein
VVLIGGLVLANYGGGVTPAEAHSYQNPFKQILGKLNEILLILKEHTAGGAGVAGGGGGGAGNQSLSWDTHDKSPLRFTVLTDFGSAAVRDSNTGLVWEKMPSTTEDSFAIARDGCLRNPVGGTKGWRLPSIPELASLIDPSVLVPGLTLTPGHPFSTVVGARYWSATSDGSNLNKFIVNFQEGSVETLNKSNATAKVWCVRGPMSESAY